MEMFCQTLELPLLDKLFILEGAMAFLPAYLWIHLMDLSLLIPRALLTLTTAIQVGAGSDMDGLPSTHVAFILFKSLSNSTQIAAQYALWGHLFPKIP